MLTPPSTTRRSVGRRHATTARSDTELLLGSYVGELEGFATRVRTGATPCVTGHDARRAQGVAPGAVESAAAERTLSRLAALGEREGVVFCLENLNTAVDHPGTPFARPRTPARWWLPSTARTCG